MIFVILGTCRADGNVGPVQSLRDIKPEGTRVMSSQKNSFLTTPLGPIYVRTAFPIIFVMGMNGLLAVAAALFIGHFAGPQAPTADTLMFPLYVKTVAVVALVSSSISSILARRLRAWRAEEPGIWLAAVVAEVLLVGRIVLVLARLARGQSLRWGLFTKVREVRA
jgi:Na+-driven multidrug efflux pump